MRVLQLIDSLEVGGAERMAVNYANALLGKIEVSALCATRAEGDLKSIIKPDIPYLFLNKKRTLDLAAFLRLRRFIRTYNIQLIQAHGSSYFTAVLVKMITPDLKVVWHDHYGNSEFLKERDTRFLKPLSRFFDGVIAVNDILSRWSKEYLNIEKSVFIKNFIADALPLDINFNPKGTKGKRLVCVANLRPQKNHQLLLKSFEELLKIDDQYTLHLFGSKIDITYSDLILSSIETSGFKDSVFYYGTHLKISSVLPYFDIGLLTSNSEGLPLSLLEYGQAGLAVVTTNVGDCARVLDGAGICVPPNDFESLVNAVLNYKSTPQSKIDYGILLQKKIERFYSSNSVLAEVIGIYEQVLN
ncbi:glycosyltransferase [Leeuwenhoekiella sp. MAR_2009_132]|uniref:glycosyltransferase n=1 Tax=Leeuwenhoekiella sp. MAR_2009_132 TaxID=1392489 RepID=UPI000491FFD1|nr:glycosyltransferase [Leeuwenhoekiella sp. MAR_2009_132]